MPLEVWNVVWKGEVAEHEHMQCPEFDDVEKSKNGLQGIWLREHTDMM